MSLNFYYSDNFVNGNNLTLDDTFTGDGTTTTFLLKNKVASQVGSTCQVDANLIFRYLGGFSFPDNTHIQFASPPPMNSQIVVPGQTSLNFEVFDQVSEPGVLGQANTFIAPFWLADDGLGSTNIIVNSYQAVARNPGIAIFFSNLATAAGANTTWLQLACANADGSIGTLQATGSVLYTDNLQALTTIAASGAALSTSLVVAAASGFYPGDYIMINPGGSTQETIQIQSINFVSNTFTTTGQNYNHFQNEIVLAQARKFFALCTLPINQLGNIAQTYINLGLTFDCLAVSR